MWNSFCLFVCLNLSCFFFKKSFTYFSAMLGLCCCAGFSLIASSGGCCLVAVRGLTAVASLVEHRLVGSGLQSLQHVGSVITAPGLQSTGLVIVVNGVSCPLACGIFPNKGSNLCLLHWQEDSLPLSHQWSPEFFDSLLLSLLIGISLYSNV